MYATPTDLTDRFRADVVADLLPIPASVGGDEEAVRTAVATDPRVTVALADASALVEAALTASRRYAAADLATLADERRPLLVRVTCELAMALLWERSQASVPAEAVVARKLAEQTLAKLSRGEIVLPLAAQGSAGLASTHTLGTLDDGGPGGRRPPTLIDRMRRYWPRG